MELTNKNAAFLLKPRAHILRLVSISTEARDSFLKIDILGVDGGFDNHKPEYEEETYSIIILPDFVSLPFPSVELPEMIRLAVGTILRAEGGLILQRLGRRNTIVNHKYYLLLPETEMTTVERELDQNTNFDWNRIQESGQEAEQLYVLGYIRLINLGNSFYLAISTDSFCSRYYKNQSLKDAFETVPADPTLDLNMQLTKLGHGLLIGKYSFPAPEDALEFFMHLLDKVERANTGNAQLDPSTSFNFGIEERLLCPTGRVSYNKKIVTILFLNIPLHEATNKEPLEAFHKLKLEKCLEGKDISSDEIVRPREPLEACLANFSAPEDVHEFYSCALNAKTTAIKPIGSTSFPDYLVLHMRKFIMEEGWVPKKLDVYIDAPDVIDISHMRSKGLQPEEELLPEGGVDGGFDNHGPEYEGAGAVAEAVAEAGAGMPMFRSRRIVSPIRALLFGFMVLLAGMLWPTSVFWPTSFKSLVERGAKSGEGIFKKERLVPKTLVDTSEKPKQPRNGHFILALTLPKPFILSEGHIHHVDYVRAGSSLHGLWPPDHWQEWVRDFDPTFNNNRPLLGRAHTHWLQLKPPDAAAPDQQQRNIQFWRSEWYKHGVKQYNTPEQYVNIALNVFQNIHRDIDREVQRLRSQPFFDADIGLITANINPVDLLGRIQTRTGVVVRLVCTYNRRWPGKEFLTGIYVNVSVDSGYSFVDMLDVRPCRGHPIIHLQN